MSLQVSQVDRRQPSQFLGIGQLVPNTKFRVTRFQYKARHNANLDREEDISELTLTDTETNQTFILKYNTVAGSPPVF